MRDDGVSGLAKGIGKGVGGLLLKPQAGESVHLNGIPALTRLGLWGLFGYPLNGIYRGIERSYGEDRQGYVVKSRIRQGYQEWEAASPEARDAVLEKWEMYEKGVRINQGGGRRSVKKS
jgi:hypothetical protein